MYSDVVTIFNRYASKDGDIWFPTLLNTVNITVDNSLMVQRYGEQSQDRAVLNIGYDKHGTDIIVAGKTWKRPKEWKNTLAEGVSDCIKAQGGQDFDFFIVGDYSDIGTIQDTDYTDGFFDYMKKNHDDVFAVTNVSVFSVIPHIEITGR